MRYVLLRLYAAYFEQGLDITDREVLAAAIAEVTGEAVAEIHPRLDDHASQRARVGDLGLQLGITYEISGPFDELLGRV